MTKLIILILAILLSTYPAISRAEMNVPSNLQVALFFKIFDFDRNLTESSNQEIIIGIFYNPQNPKSLQAMEEIKTNFLKLSDRKINGKSILIKEIQTIDEIHDIHIIYVTPENEASITEIVNKCTTQKILGISGIEDYARKGLAIAIELKNQKPNIIINKSAADLSGAKLSSKILALAQIL